jgi:hypothetical protein
MRTKLVSAIGAVVALGVVGIAVVLGVQQYQHKQRLAAFQVLIQEGSGQAEATLGMIFAKSILTTQISAECERYVQVRRDYIAKVAASEDISSAPEVRQEYVSLLNAESELMMSVGTAMTSLNHATQIIGKEFEGQASKADYCIALENSRKDSSVVRDEAQSVLSLEKHLKSTCSTHGLACEPVFAKYEKDFNKTFEDAGPGYGCPQR